MLGLSAVRGGFCLIGLLGLGLGAIIRHSAAAVGVLVAGVYVGAQVIGIVAHGVAAYMPILIVENSLSTTKPVTCGRTPRPAPTSCPRGPGSACWACTPSSHWRSADGCWPGGTRERKAWAQGGR